MDSVDRNECIARHGGRVQYGINWIWAYFDDLAAAKACFDELNKDPMFEHRGPPDERVAAFRFR